MPTLAWACPKRTRFPMSTRAWPWHPARALLLRFPFCKGRRVPAQTLFRDHARDFQENRYVYPVSAAAPAGSSIGVNLNLDKACNFHCIYCQVDRTQMGPTRARSTSTGWPTSLTATVELVSSGRIYDDPRFADTPAALRRLNDIAFSGDGEPTTYPQLRRGRRRLRRGPRPARPGRREAGADHQRQHVPPRTGPPGPGDPGRQQRRDLGQARRRHRDVLPAGRPHRPSRFGRSSTTSARPPACDRSSSRRC